MLTLDAEPCSEPRKGPSCQTGPNVIKLFTSVIDNVRNMLECLSLAGLSSLVQRLRERPGVGGNQPI